MIKAICNHCNKFGKVHEIGKYYLCEEHKDLKQYQPKEIKKPKKIKQRSKKLEDKNKVYLKINKEYLKKNPLCECGCGQSSTEIHHKGGRIGDMLVDTFGFMAVNSVCHRLIHDDHEFALNKGYVWSLEYKNNYLRSKK